MSITNICSVTRLSELDQERALSSQIYAMISSMIVETLVVGPFATNCYIVASELTRRGIIIDPGAQAKNILQAVGQSGVSISMIVLTHAHIDHFGALKAVRESTTGLNLPPSTPRVRKRHLRDQFKL